MFVAVWFVIHACMGQAVWRVRADTRDPVPPVLLAAGYTQSSMFWLADATGLLLAGVTFWVFTRYSRAAARWLLPWLLRMPLTLAIKIVVLV